MNKFITNIKIAWRNLWRNKRRTIITTSSVFFAVFFSILMRSFQIGTYSNMINNVITKFSGHLQIQKKEYIDNKTIDNSIAYTDSLIFVLEKNKNIDFYFPKIQTNILASSKVNSKAGVVMGIDLKKENKLIKLENNIVKYYLDSNILNEIKINNKNIELLMSDKVFSCKENLVNELVEIGIDNNLYINKICKKAKLPEIEFKDYGEQVIIGYKLAHFLELNIGDSIIITGQGFRGATATGKYKIEGFLNFPTNGFNERLIYMPIHTSQIFLSAYELNNLLDTTFFVNYISINTLNKATIQNQDYKKLLKVKSNIENSLTDNTLAVVDWHDLNKDLFEGIKLDNGSGKIMIFILYLIIAFGVLGTVMMMIEERKKEFGIMMAIGMTRKHLSIIVSMEMFLMGIIATLLGIIVTSPIIWFGHNNPVRLKGRLAESMETYNIEPILLFQNFDTYIFAQLLVVVIIVWFVLVYALLKIKNLKIISAIKANG